MKTFRSSLVMFFLLSLLSACSPEGVSSIKIIHGGTLNMEAGAIENAHIFMLDGSLRVPEGAVIRGDVYQLLGEFELDGRVEGSVVLLSGVLVFGEQAYISGDLRYGGGEMSGQSPQKIGGQLTRSEIQVPFSPAWFDETIQRRVNYAVFEILSLTVLAFLLGAVAPQGLERVQAAIRQYPHVSGAMGMLAGMVGLVLLIQMLFTILLIPISLLGFGILFFAVGLGWTAFGLLLGTWLSDRFTLRWSLFVRAGAGTFIFVLLLNLVRLLPLIGDVLAILSALVGFGAVFLTRFGFRRFTSASQKPLFP